MNTRLKFKAIALFIIVCITVTACSYSNNSDSVKDADTNVSFESINDDSADNTSADIDTASSAPEVITDEPAFIFPDTVRVLLLSPNKSIIHPKKDVKESEYPGAIEIHDVDGGYVYINEVGLEDYVKGVLPGEMPESFGLEALKAQAVCARTYVCSKKLENGYPEYNAIVDDSTNFQVYAPKSATKLTDKAVDETHGQILVKNDFPIEALYFSTSCGYTQSTKLFPLIEDQSLLKSVYVSSVDAFPVVNFDEYLRTDDSDAYESGEKYFRWKIRIDTKAKNIAMINKITALTDDTGDIEYSEELLKKIEYAKMKCYSMSGAFGKLTHMDIIKRDDGGVITSLKLTYENGTVTINDQLKIRRILGSAITSTLLNDGSSPDKISMLYSAAFTWDVGQNGQYVLYGGGYGHGCGMSQYAAGKMGQSGYLHSDILAKFYPNAELVLPD